MKASTVLILIFCVGILNCCGPADEMDFPDPGYFEIIQGRWYPVETIAKGVSYPYTGHEPCGKDFLEFSQESLVKFVNIHNCIEREDNSGTFSIKGLSLTFYYNKNEEILLKIAHLDSGSLELIYIDNLDGDGVDEETRRYSRE